MKRKNLLQKSSLWKRILQTKKKSWSRSEKKKLMIIVDFFFQEQTEAKETIAHLQEQLEEKKTAAALSDNNVQQLQVS